MQTVYRDNYNFEKEFNNEVREKKRIGSGAFHKKGKGVKNGIVGGLKFPYENMSNKDKRAYTKGSEVIVSNIYESIVPMHEFKTYTKEKQRELLLNWRKIHKNGVISDALGISVGSFHGLIVELDLPKKTKGNNTGGKTKQWDDHHNLGEFPEIIQYRDFVKMEHDDQYVILDDLIKVYKKTDIQKEWKVSSSRFYAHIKELNLMSNHLKDKKIEADEIKSDVIKEIPKTFIEERKDVVPEVVAEEIVKEVVEDVKIDHEPIEADKEVLYGMIMEMKESNVTSGKVAEKLERIIRFIADDDGKYEINLSLKELK